jgi:hypothetical protein
MPLNSLIKVLTSCANACVLRLSELPTFPLDRLSRYEHLLWRQSRQLVFTLESLRRRVRPRSRSNFPFTFRPNGN